MRKLALISFLMVAALFWGCGQTDLSDDFKQNGQLRMEIKGYVRRAAGRRVSLNTKQK